MHTDERERERERKKMAEQDIASLMQELDRKI
jgi:hypothetical protein